MFESVEAKGVIICYHDLRTLYAVADRPPCFAAVQVIYQHLQVFTGLGCKGEFQSAIYRVAELPLIGSRRVGVEQHGIIVVARMLLFEVFGEHKRIADILENDVCADRQLDVFCKGVAQGNAVYLHNAPVAVAVVVNVQIKDKRAVGVVYLHVAKSCRYFLRISRMSRFVV